MSNEIKFAYLKSHPLFSNLSEQKINDISNYAKVNRATFLFNTTYVLFANLNPVK